MEVGLLLGIKLIMAVFCASPPNLEEVWKSLGERRKSVERARGLNGR